MAPQKSTTLFHFTKTPEILQSILFNGFQPRYSLEDTSWLGIKGLEYCAYPMTCFCDIPLTRIADHVGFYGNYGIGMSKAWALKNGLNPILYVTPSSPLAKALLVALQRSIKLKELPNASDIANYAHLNFIHAHAKPLSGSMVLSGKPVKKDFYFENEWRYVPQVDGLPQALIQKVYDEKANLDEWNKVLIEKATLRFTPADILYIFVATDADIPPLVDYITAKLAAFPWADIKILTTRITSLEHLHLDA